MNLDQSGFVQALKARHPSLKEQIVNIGGANSARFLRSDPRRG